MNKPLLITLLAVSSLCYSQSDELSFDYDSAGNQIVRELICISCNTPAGRPVNTNSQDYVQSKEYSEISFFPNPVQQELFIKWNTEENFYVTNLEVYSMSGQLIFSQSDLKDKTTTSVNFLNASQGVYNVLLFYSNGEKKVLKIVKK